ncbi:hypothetical protein D0T87_13645 [Bacteroides sp. 51]|nr:hypothetical protein [Bacteroides sp. 51]
MFVLSLFSCDKKDYCENMELPSIPIITRSVPTKGDSILNGNGDDFFNPIKVPPVDFDFSINGTVGLLWNENLGIGTLVTEYPNLDDNLVIEVPFNSIFDFSKDIDFQAYVNMRMIGFEYSCNNGIITFEINRSYWDEGNAEGGISLGLLPRLLEIRYVDRIPTIYHHGSDYVLDRRDYKICVSLVDLN